MNHLKYVLFLSLIGLTFVACSSESKQTDTDTEQATSNEELSDAQYVERASFMTLEGETVRTADLEGKVVLIDFWETWCKPCLAIFPTMQKLLEEYPDDFAVLAVNPGFADTKEDAEKFIAEHDYEFTYLLDNNGLSDKLGVQSIPYKIFVDAEGNYIKSELGSYGAEEDYKELKSIIENNKAGADRND